MAPELMVGFAARQLWAAWIFSEEFDVSITHGFFISMGGFVSRIGHHPITTKEQLRNIEYISGIQQVEVEDIRDKSKGDVLAKGVALTQGLWFISKCLTRVHQHLPVAELEVTTLAFAVINILIWLLWWSKPLDIEQPILVGSAQQRGNSEPPIQLLGLVDMLDGVITGRYSYLPVASTSVPSFWAMNYDEAGREGNNIPFCIECLVGTVFGAIHCAAWNAGFPSTTELWMWRSCSLLVAVIPAVLGLIAALYSSSRAGAVQNILDEIGSMALVLSVPFYIIARLSLIILPLVSLRALPPGAFIDIDWSVYIPHL
ncbi:hypothetical protein DFH08DRAFT_971241 [Mycena albidolilacea]|uniref:Uncharacterized protein n=1 Tax=Mycena albidolilacea TaxID=1033008 RepID=A0AAD7EER1_9AGAR|nr:hypothetical protein DFH08DRAFT_971241 [Mycena albidolilacea]